MFIRIAGGAFPGAPAGRWRARGSSPMTSTRCPSMSTGGELERAERIAAPEEYVRNRERPMSAAQRQRYDMLRPGPGG